MRLFFKLAKEILLKPTWGIVIAIIAVVGNIQVVIDIVEAVSGKDLSYLGDNPTLNNLLLFTSRYWLPILLFILLFAITNGIFQKSRNYLGDRIVASQIVLTPKEDKHKADGNEKYAWIQIDNKEEFDLRECYAVLKTLKIKSGDMWLPWEEIANENISHLTFPEFQDREVIIHAGNPVRLNIAKTPNGNSVLFIFKRGDKSVPHTGEGIYIEVVLGGTVYGANGERHKIEDKLFKGFLISESGMDEPYETQVANTDTKVEMEGNKKIITTTRVEETRMEGPHRWYRLYIKQGELSNER